MVIFLQTVYFSEAPRLHWGYEVLTKKSPRLYWGYEVLTKNRPRLRSTWKIGPEVILRLRPKSLWLRHHNFCKNDKKVEKSVKNPSKPLRKLISEGFQGRPRVSDDLWSVLMVLRWSPNVFYDFPKLFRTFPKFFRKFPRKIRIFPRLRRNLGVTSI